MNIVRAIDLGCGVTKFIRRVEGTHIECGQFQSIAKFSMRHTTGDAFGGLRDTVAVPIGEWFYEVGPDIDPVLGAWRSTMKGENYIETPEYLALMRGALYYMNTERWWACRWRI